MSKSLLKKDKLVQAMKIAMRGKQQSKSDLRPQLSMVLIAGIAKKKLRRPKPMDASSAPRSSPVAS
jgi:hypothetical protein